MTERLHHYVTPFIYPLFPRSAGRLVVNYSVRNILAYRTTPDFTGNFTLTFSVFVDGEQISREEIAIPVRNGQAEIGDVVRNFESDGLGYVEVGITADGPAFDKIALVQGYGLFVHPQRGAMTFGSDLKFARGPIIDQIAKYGLFCMQHSAAFIDKDRNIGNSFLLINPYQQAIVATFASSTGARVKRRIDKLSAQRLPLDELLQDGEWATVMVTANNRLTVFDIRHAHDDPLLLNNIDHLDFMNGWSTHSRRPPVQAARYWLRRLGRESAVYFS
ncbi:MAG: hypothetical protein ACTSX7_13835 [Alphaproteobacteria bacterium]